MTASIRLACCLFTLCVAPISWSRGSVEGGAALSGTCMACHGVNGNSTNPAWPNLAGQNAAYIEHQLHLFHDGRRTGKMGDASASMMPAMATTLTDQNIEDAACHGPSGRGNPAAGYPALRAQHAVYLVKQLNAYGTEVRYAKNEHGASYGGDNAGIMHTIAARLSDEDMRNVASYIQGMR